MGKGLLLNWYTVHPAFQGAVWYYCSMILICISLRIMKLDTFYYTKWLLSIFFGEIHIQMLFLNYLVSPFWLIFGSYYLT